MTHKVRIHAFRFAISISMQNDKIIAGDWKIRTIRVTIIVRGRARNKSYDLPRQVRFNDSSMQIRNFSEICFATSFLVLDKQRTRPRIFQTVASTVAGKRLSDRSAAESAAVAMPGSFWLIGQYSLLAPRGSCITQRDVEKLPDWDALINNPCAMCVPARAREPRVARVRLSPSRLNAVTYRERKRTSRACRV